MKITKEELIKVKNEIIDKNLSEEEKNNIVNEVNKEISKILNDFEKSKNTGGDTYE